MRLAQRSSPPSDASHAEKPEESQAGQIERWTWEGVPEKKKKGLKAVKKTRNIVRIGW
jgi:hypothetical protein